MTTSAPRRKLLFSINRLLAASRSARVKSGENGRVIITQVGESFNSKFGTFGRSFDGTRKDKGYNPVLHDFSNSRRVVSGGFITCCNVQTRDQRKFEGISASLHCVHRRRADDFLADAHSRAGVEGRVAAIELIRENAHANGDPLPDPSPERSFTSGVLERECPRIGSAPTSRIRIRFHSRDYREGIWQACVNDGPTFCQNSYSSQKWTNSNCERNDESITDPSSSSTYHLTTSSGRARPDEYVFPLHCGVQGRHYSLSSKKVPSVSENHGDDGSKMDGAARHGGKEAGEKTWIQMVFPEKLRPYAHLARLDKPIGTWLLAWPCFWSICLAAPSGSLPDLEILGWFGLGALLLRGAGCTVNDLLDSDIDGKVERTRQRPIASGAITPFQGLSFLGFQLLLGLGVLLQLNDFSKILGASSLVLVGTYPLMKRWTFWPQAYLGVTFNWGALLGWAAVHGTLDLSTVLPLYASGVCWTLVYDTIYAHQDKEDDMKVGVKSTALQFGNKTKLWLAGFSTGCVTCLTLAGFNGGVGWPFYVGMAATAGHLAWQVSTVDIHNRVDCNSKFVSNKWFGAIVCSAIVFGKLAESST